MKKILITSALAVVLIAGYIVGQMTFAEHTDKPRILPIVDKQASPGVDSYELHGENSSSGKASPDVVADGVASTDIPICDDLPDCGIPTPVGDPKGTKIIKTGTVDITIKRDSVNKNYDKVVTLISDGGYVESSTSSRRTSTLTVRIPADKLDATLKALRKIGTITDESISSYDRSYDAVDYDARLKIMRERETVLNNELKNASAADSSQIQEQLFQLHGDIESLEGQKNLLDSQVAMSTLTVSLTEKGVHKDDPGEQTMLGKAWTTAVDSLLTTVGGILIVLAALLPFLLLAGLGFVIVRAIIRKKADSKE